MHCFRCNQENRTGRKHCARCGVMLGDQCSRCASVNYFAEFFCGNCGTTLPRDGSDGNGGAATNTVAEDGASFAYRGERSHWRQLSVLFCDLVGYTRLSGRLNAETLRDLLRAYQQTCHQSVERHGGWLARFVGDGVMAYFGYPTASENNARHGIFAALDIQAALVNGGGGDALTEPLRARIGLASGWVVAGDRIGRRASEQRPVVGFTPNLASRIQQAAPPGGVAVDRATHDLARGAFAFRDIGALGGMELHRPQSVFAVAAPRLLRTRLAAVLRRPRSVLRGRRAECRRLHRQWRRALGGHGQVALLCGERGIGKSRLLREVCAGAGRRALRWVHQCRTADRHRNLQPLVDCGGRMQALTRRIGGGGGSGDGGGDDGDGDADGGGDGGGVGGGVAATGGVGGARNHALLPPLAGALRRVVTASVPVAMPLARLLAAMERAGQGALLAVDDAQHLDARSHQLLDVLVPLLRRRRVMVVLTFTPDCAPLWLEHGHVRLYRLQRITRNAAVALAYAGGGGERTGVTDAAAAEAAARVADVTDGVPLFIVEQSRHAHTDGGDGAANYARPPPAWLTDFFTAMLDRTGDAAEVARTAAAIGVEFGSDTLAAIYDGDSANLQRHLSQLKTGGFLIQRGAGRYRFRYQLLQRAAWHSLLERTQTRLRQKIADFNARTSGAEE